MLHLLDILLTILHLLVIIVNLFGWLIPRFRRFHLIVVATTVFSWLVLGIWFGWGYCFITDWQWRIKEKLGEHNLPASFIKYYADKLFHKDFDPAMVDVITAGSFALAVVLTVYFNFLRRRKRAA